MIKKKASYAADTNATLPEELNTFFLHLHLHLSHLADALML
jgi:hypothetical protein